jgi:nucleotide-binding universal stress UspA family protein
MRIVYATDGSPGAVAVGEFLARLRLTAQDTVLVVGVASRAEEESREQLVGVALRTLAGSAAQVQAEIRTGEPEAQLLECSGEHKVDLLALGAIGSTGLVQFLIGGVTERALRHAQCPVLVARPLKNDLRKAMIAVDNSVMAAKVTQAAAQLPLPEQTEVELVHVLPNQEAIASLAPMIWANLSGEMDELLNQQLADAEERLRGLAEILREPGRTVSAEVLRGDPATSLTTAAETEQADLVVVGSHGEGGVDRFLLGSVSERVARHAPCSVLVVR